MALDLIILLGIHFLSDFIFQSREMGKKKSENINFLFAHLLIIVATFLLCGLFRFSTDVIIPIAIMYGIIHCFQDWFIWRGYKLTIWYRIKGYRNASYPYWEDRWFYAVIGLDQTLHFITIVLLYNWMGV